VFVAADFVLCHPLSTATRAVLQAWQRDGYIVKDFDEVMAEGGAELRSVLYMTSAGPVEFVGGSWDCCLVFELIWVALCTHIVLHILHITLRTLRAAHCSFTLDTIAL
jgi:hypothetical protein